MVVIESLPRGLKYVKSEMDEGSFKRKRFKTDVNQVIVWKIKKSIESGGKRTINLKAKIVEI